MPRHTPETPSRQCHGLNLALDAPVADAAGHDDAVGQREPLLDGVAGELLGVDPQHAQLSPVVDGRVLERLPHREVGLVELYVLAHEGDGHGAAHRVDALDEGLPLREVGLGRLETQLAHDQVVEPPRAS
jgi:hypothetical protein